MHAGWSILYRIQSSTGKRRGVARARGPSKHGEKSSKSGGRGREEGQCEVKRIIARVSGQHSEVKKILT